MDWKAELERAWDFLGADGQATEGGLATYRLTEDARPLRLLLDSDGTRHLLVPGHPKAGANFVAGRELRCAVRSLEFAGTQQSFLDIACGSAHLFDVFDDLLVSIVAGAISSGDPLLSALSMLERWQDLLRAWAGDLSYRQEMGLFAELFVLEIISAVAGRFDPASWRGPAREPKDVVLRFHWVEVKAVAERTAAVTINGLDQLTDLAGTSGYLAVLTVVEDAAGTTVAELVEQLSARATDPSMFVAGLAQVGWPASGEARSWSVTAMHVVRADSCPRLTRDALGIVPAGVANVRYEIDLRLLRGQALPGGAALLASIGEMS